ncbi:hypothetical protein ABPG74_002787, partial [Tetrahymena malaccensis]
MLRLIHLFIQIYIIIIQLPNHVKAITCSSNQCYYAKLSTCVNILPNYTGNNTQGSCVSDREKSNILSCVKNSNLICMNSSKTMCILLNSDPNDIYIGNYLDANSNLICIQKTDIQLTLINTTKIQYLKTGYCYKSDSMVYQGQQMKNSFMCECPQNYCYDGQKCVLMGKSSNVGKNSLGKCVQLQVIDDVQSCFNDGSIICLFKISQTTSKCIAYAQNLNVLGVYNYQGVNYCLQQSQINQKTILDTTILSLKGKTKPVEGAQTNFNCVLNNSTIDCNISIDQCSQQSICLDDNECLYYDPDTFSSTCVSLSSDINSISFAKEQITSNCIPYQPLTGQAQDIDKCPPGFCIYMVSLTQKYCIFIGSFINGNQFIGAEQYTQLCLQQLQLSYLGISQCYGDNCILKYQNYYVCHPLQISSTFFQTNQSVKAKLSDGTCTDLNQVVSVRCLPGDYCILNGACIPLDSNNQNAIGRSIDDETCLPQYTSPSSNCALNFCLQNNQCVPLSQMNPARENQTGKCMQPNDPGTYGAISCYIDYCLLKGSSQNQNICVQIDYQHPNQLGRYQGTGICVSENDKNTPHVSQNIQLCFRGVYCIATNSNGEYCQKVGGIYKCQDQQGRCILKTDSTPCINCPFDQCLLNGSCVALNDTYCQDNNGQCLDVNQSGCKVCPLNYCLQQQYQTCQYYNQIDTSNYSQSECLYQYRQDMPCLKENIDNMNQFKILLCKDKNNLCQDISTANQNKQCLVCPKYFFNPGDDSCQQQIKQIENSFFNLNLQYVLEDCFPNSDCSNSSQKCPEGCRKCLNQDTCTQCIEGYFLYQDQTNNNSLCVKCDSQKYQNNVSSTSQLYNYFQKITYQCAECNLQQNQWLDQTLSRKICTQMVVNFNGINKFDPYFSQTIYYQIQRGPTQGIPYFQQLKTPLSYLYLQEIQQPSQCSSQCLRCVKDYSGVNRCLKCQQLYYATPQYTCQPCPFQCLECGMSNLIGNQFFNFEDLSYQQYLDGVFNMDEAMFSCRYCQQGYLLNFDFQTCVSCGFQCQECVYVNSNGQFVNKKYYNFGFYDISSLKPYCLRCSSGFKPSSNKGYIPSVSGCIPCPQGCVNCYEIGFYQCETCEDQENYFLNGAYDLYQTKCYSCKQQITSQYQELQKYEIRYDKTRMKCQLCLKNDNGCFFKKQSYVYVFCGSYEEDLGSGTQTDPYNLFKISQINIDSLILNEPDVNRAYVFYNELQLRELELIIQYVDPSGVCIENVSLNLQSNLRNKISSLEYMTLTIRADQSQNYQTFFTIYQTNVAQISGFNQIQIQNLNIISKYQDGQFGYSSQNTAINQIQLQNITFISKSLNPNLLFLSFQDFNGSLAIIFKLSKSQNAIVNITDFSTLNNLYEVSVQNIDLNTLNIGQPVGYSSAQNILDFKGVNSTQLKRIPPVSFEVPIQNIIEIQSKIDGSVLISNFQGSNIYRYFNKTEEDLQIQLINAENQPISQLKNDIVLKLEAGSGDFLVYPTEIKQNNGLFNLSNILHIYGRLGSNLKIKVTSDFNYIPNYDLQGNLIQISQNIYFELDLQFRKLCPTGTTLIVDENKKDMCYKCPTGTFNLQDGQSCIKCPFVCQNSQIFLPSGIWRSSLISYNYQQCFIPQNCVGDIDKQISEKLQNTSNRYCNEGNIGVFCLDCDLKGTYWENRYQQITPYTCQASDKNTTIAALFFMQIQNIPYLVKLYLGVVSYITVQDQKYLKDFPSEVYNTKQIGLIISSSKHFLENQRSPIYLQFMYQEYNCYWWEIASCLHKIVLYLVQGIYFQQQMLRDTICCSICFSYATSILYFEPYKRKEFNFIEVIISFGLSVSFGLMSYINQKNYLDESLTIISLSKHVKATTCSSNQCYSAKLISCVNFQPDYIGKNTQGSCVSDREKSNILSCIINSNLICKNSSNTMCVLLNSDPNDIYIGSYLDVNSILICIQSTDIQLTQINTIRIQYLKAGYCYKSDSMIYQGQQMQNSFMCECSQNYCFDGKNCVIMDKSLNVGKNNLGECVQLQVVDQVKSCFDDGQVICLFKVSQTTSKCIAYAQNLNVLGVYSYQGVNYCLQQSQINQKTIIDSIIQLNSAYCYNNNKFEQIPDVAKQIIGITSKFNCFLFNSTVNQSDPIKSCIKGQAKNKYYVFFTFNQFIFNKLKNSYCISQQACIQMNSYNIISKRQDQTCGGNSEKNFLECYTSAISKTTCINNNSCELISSSSTFVGAQGDFSCVKSNQMINTDIGQQIMYCSQYYCINQQDLYGVIGQNKWGKDIYGWAYFQRCQLMNYNSQDSNGYCKYDFNKIICQDDNQCLQNDPSPICVDLSSDINSSNFAKEQKTSNCLPYQPLAGQAQDIDKCPPGFCIQMMSQTQKYCVALGSFIKGNQVIGVEQYTQFCLKQLQLSYLGISWCYGDNCVLKYQNYYVCHPLQISSTYFQTNQSVKAKLSDGTCADLNQTVSVKCLSGDYCIFQDACIQLDSNNQNAIGRSIEDEKCLPQNTGPSSNCALDFCLQNNKCLPLSEANPARENQTGKCLQSNDKGMYGAKSCYIKFKNILKQIFLIKLYLCQKLIGRYQGTSICVNENDKNIPHLSQNIVNYSKKFNIYFQILQKQLCFKGVYCIATNSNGEYCQNVEGIYKCQDSQGRCILQTDSTPCSSCSFSECLLNGSCVALNNTYCQDNNGKKIYVNQTGCQVCPLNYCLQQQYQTCQYYNQIDTFTYSQSECLYQYRQDMPCFKENIDNMNKFKILLCKDKNNLCQNLSTANQNNQCLVCPKYFFNPGDDTCYQQIKQIENSYFNFNLQYFLEDCYPSSDCSNNSQKCPEGCRQCQSKDACTQCIEGYFLYQDPANNNSICIKCDSQKYQIDISSTSQLFNFVKKITYECAECNLEQNQWQDQTLNSKICTQMVISFNGLNKFDPYFSQTIYYQIQKGPTQGIPYFQQLKTPLSYLYLQYIQQPSLCSSQCLRCVQDHLGVNRCLKCQQFYYVTPQYTCQPCPSYCLECGMSKLVGNQFFNFEDISYKQYLDGVFNMNNAMFTCRYCQQGFLLNFDFQSCVPCGFECQECVYANADGKFVNKKYYNFGLHEQQSLKPYCLRCSTGFKHSWDHFDCSQIILDNQSSCYDYDTISSINLVSTKTFLNYVYQPGETEVFNCNYCAFDIFEYNSCLFNYPLIIDPKGQLFCDINLQCNHLMSNCLECYEFQQYQDGLLFQCIKCKEGYIPSVSGCIPCPKGCVNCYEIGFYQQNKVNFTNIFIYERQILLTLTLQQRISYYSLFQIQMLCSVCEPGRFLSISQLSCDFPSCGKYCQTCIFYLDQPYCVQCNSDLLFSEIASIQMHIAQMYFNSVYFDQINLMISLDQNQYNCKLCPMLCQTCEDKSSYFINGAYDLYDTKCYSCKQKIVSQYQELERYEIRYDKKRMKCQLCLKNDNGCYFKKQSYVYVFCGSYDQNLGSGTLTDPYNLFKISQINIDSLILNEPDVNRAYVFYNELQLRELELIIQYVDPSGVCIENVSLNLQTNLKSTISSLEHMTLTIKADQNQNYQTFFTIYQTNVAQISGFSQIQIQNLNIISKYQDGYFGYQSQNTTINQIQLQNITFISKSQNPNLLFLSFQNFKGNLVINNVSFINITTQNKNLIDFTFYQIQTPQTYTITNIIFQNCTFISSQFFTFEFQGQLNIYNLVIIQSLFQHQSTLVQASLIVQQQSSTFNLTNLTISKSRFYNNSIIIYAQNFNEIIFTEVEMSGNQIISDLNEQSQLPSLFYLDQVQISQFKFINNTIYDTLIFELSVITQSLNEIRYCFAQFQLNSNFINTNKAIIFQLSKSQNAIINITDFQTLNNMYGVIGASQSDNHFFQFYSITNLIIKNITIQDDRVIQFVTVQSVQDINLNILNIGKSVGYSSAQNVLDFKGINQTCIVQNVMIKQVITYQQLILIHQVMNQINSSDQSQYLIKLSNFIFDEIELKRIPPISLEQPIQNIIEIQSKIDGSVHISNFQGNNIYRKFNKKEEYLQTQLFLSTVLLIQMQIGLLQIENSFIQTNYVHPQHNLLQVSCQFINLTNTSFSIKENQNNKLTFDDSTLKGGIINLFAQQVQIFNATFQGGLALQGGAIYFESQQQTKVYIQQSNFIQNWSFNQKNKQECFGGAIYFEIQLIQSAIEIFVLNSTFQNNLSLYQGGSIYISNSLHKYFLVIKKSHFNDNLSLIGSNIYAFQSKQTSQIIMDTNLIQITEDFNMFSQDLLPYFSQQMLQSVTPSLFSFYNQISIDIIQCIFQSNLLNNQVANSDLAKIQFQEIINFKSINILTLKQNQYNQFQVYNNLISILSSQKILIQWDIFDSNKLIDDILYPQRTQIKSLLQITSDSVTIKNVRYQKNVCTLCEQGNISVDSKHLLIYQSMFQENIALNGGSLYLQMSAEIESNRILRVTNLNEYQIQYSQANQTIQNCSFIENNALQSGGSIYIANSLIYLTNLLFTGNKAQIYGGAIASDKKFDSKFQNIFLTFSTFMNNQALIGSVFYQMQNLPIQTNYKNTLKNNYAKLYGNQLQQSAVGFIGIQNGKRINTKITIKNYLSGTLQEDLQIQLINAENQPISQLKNDIVLKLEAGLGDFLVYPTEIKQNNGLFNLSNILQVYGRLGSSLQIKVTSDFNYIPNYDLQGNLIQISQNIYFELDFQFRKLCPTGTTLVLDENKKDKCYKCPTGTFNLQDGQSCIKCPFVCQNSQMFLPSGFWRSSLMSYEYQECFIQQNCVGDIDKQISQKLKNNSNRYCREGNIGVFCLDCDLKGAYWEKRYQQITPYNCQVCKGFQNFTSLIIFLINLLFYWFVIIIINKQIQVQKLKKVFYLLKVALFQNHGTFNLLKIFVNYLIVLGFISPLINYLPILLQQLVLELFNLPNNMLVLLDCNLSLLFDAYQMPYFHLRIYFSSIVLLLIFSLVYFFTQICLRSDKNTTFAAMFFIQIHNIPYLVKLYLGVVSQITVQGQSYLKDFPSEALNTKQIGFTISNILICFQFLFLLALIYFLKRKKHFLETSRSPTYLRFMYQDYHFYWWEITSYFYKICLYLVQGIYFQQQILRDTICCSICFSYAISILYFEPYKRKEFNFIEVIISFGLSVSFGLMSYIKRLHAMLINAIHQCFDGTKCIQMDKNINVGINIQGQCVKLSVIDNIQSCFNDGTSICFLQLTQNTSKCIAYAQNVDIIGVYNYQNVNYCLSQSQVNQTIPINNIINLNSTYCYYHNQFVRIPNQALQIIGITVNYNCFLSNSTVIQTDPLKSCIQGYCISQQKCIQMNSYNLISKRQDQTCGGNSEKNFLECYTSLTSKTTCINGNSCELIVQSNNFVGAQENFNCVATNQQVNIGLGLMIMYCSQYYCIQEYQIEILIGTNKHGDDIYKTITVQQCQMMQWYIQDSLGYCVPQALNNVCLDDNQCLTYDYVFKQYICVNLSTDMTSPYFAKEQETSKCLPYQPITGQAQNIYKCPTGFCIYMVSQSQKYCVALGSFLQGNQYIGAEKYTQLCLQQLELSYLGIQSCYGNNCVLKYENYYVCHPLQYSSTYFQTTQSVKAKLQDGTCADLNQTVSVNCLAGDYCILLGACVELDSSNQFTIGRNLNDQTCIPQNTIPASNCAENYCLLNNQCYPLSAQNPARESQTGKCIQANDPGMFGASSCFIDYCLILGTQSNQNVCKLIDYQQQTQLGRYQGTGICVSQTDQNIPHLNQKIQFCFRGVYCIASNSNGDFCQKVEGIYKCSDSQGKCVLFTDSTACSRCSFSECLLNGVCITLDNTYCQDTNGNCLNVNQPGCMVCPQNYCLQQASQTCLYYNYMLSSSYGNSECLYQYRQDMPCFKQNIDNMNEYKILLCKDKNNLCQNIKTANQNKQCLVCPKYFFNPGDDSCYQQVQQVQDSYFNFKLQYVLEDCYPNSDCSFNSQKCPEGCRKCSNQKTCTQCIEGYFLFQDIANQNQICIKCGSQQYTQDINPSSQLFSIVKQITYQCAECNLEINQWSDQTLTNKICTQMVTNFAGLNKFDPNFGQSTYYQIQKGPTQGIPFFQQLKTPLSYLNLQQIQSPFHCSNNCVRCYQDNQGISRCIKCEYLYYVTPQYICQPCPSQCQECGMSTLVGSQFYNFEDITFEQYINGAFNMNNAMFSCRYCQAGFLINYDFQTCIPCGIQCQECVYILPDGKFTNKKYYNFGIYQAQSVMSYCIRCSPGFKRSFNRYDCSPIVDDTKNCFDYDIISSVNLKSTKTYLNYVYQPGETNVFNCNYCSYISCLSPFHRNCIGLGNPTNLNQTSIVCQTYTQNGLSIVGNDYEYNKCLFNYPLIITTAGKLFCDSNLYCNKLIKNCLNCFEFQHYKDGLLFQCIECKEGFIPSVSGCIPCPNGCLNCYEIGFYQQQKVNFTNIFIYETQMLLSMTLEQRVQYYDLYQVQMLCSICETGRVLSSTQASCDSIVCGKYCQTCMLYQDQPFCVQCNSNLLLAEITSIQMYIAQMYFNSIFLNQIDQMISLDQSQQNCKLCPMLCETCQDRNNYFLNGAYDLYDTKCYSCKQKIISQYQELERYEIRYDKSRMKCQLCLKNDNGCYFKKQSHVYVFCGSYNQNLGSGTQTDPYNLFKISQVNINSLILNEADVNRAYVFYNELQLRELELIIEYVDQSGVCIENAALNLKTNLKSTISSLEFMTLTIKANQTKDYQTFFTVQQIAVAQISGFSQIQIQNLNIVSKYSSGYFGYLSQNTTINKIQFQNVTFSSQSLAPNLLWLSFQFFNGTLIINNVAFNNITIQNQSLIDLKFQQITNPQTYSLTNIAFQNCTFTSSQFIIFQFQGELSLYNISINQSSFLQKSALILASLQILKTTSTFNLTKISINYSNFYNNSIIVYAQNFNQTTISKLDLFNNKIISESSDSKEVISLFYFDEVKISQLQFVSNTLQNTIIFQLSAIQQNSNLLVYNFTSFEIHSNVVNSNSAIIFQLSKSQNAIVNITDFQIQSNTYSIQDISQQNNKYFSFNQITSLIIVNLSIQDNIIVQFVSVQSIQQIDLNILNIGQLTKQSIAYNILNFQNVNSTCTIKNAVLRQLSTYQQVILIHQIMNDINSNDRDIYQIKLLNFTLYDIELKRIPPISLEIPIQNIIEIQSKIDGNVLISNFQATNIYRKFNKTEEYLRTQLYFSTVLLIQMQIGYLQVENSLIQSYYGHPQHNILQISCQQIKLVNSSFILQENQNTKFLYGDSTQKGGILNLFAPQVQIFNTTFQGGLALQGGAIYLQSQQQTKVYIMQSSFIDNWSFNQKNKQECYGGAIYFDISLSQYKIEFFILNSTFKNNLSLYQGGSIYISNSLLKYFFVSQYNHFTDNLSLSGSNIYAFQSKNISQITMYVDLVQITDKFIILSQNLLPYFSQQMLESANVSLFSFQNFYSVDVIQCIFQSIQTNNQQNNVNLARLTFQAIMNFKSIGFLTLDQNQYNQLLVYNNLISIQNSQKVLIQWDIFVNNQLANLLQYPKSTQIKSLLSINSNSTIIKKLTYQNNICALCDQGNILIDSSHLFVYQSIFKGNTAINGGSLYLQMSIKTDSNRILQNPNTSDYLILFSQANQTILNCSFIENTALESGGSIFIENTLIYLSNLLFDGNKAKLYGGALVSDNNSDQALQNLELTFSTFMNNQALIGSVFFQMQNLPIQKIFQNTLKHNFAQLYGNQLQQSAVGFKGILNGKQHDSKIVIQNFLSGLFQDDLQIQLINTENQAISQLKNDIVLKLEVGVGDFEVFPSEIKQSNGLFNLSNILYVYGRLGSELKIRLTSDFNYIPNYDLQGNLINVSQNIYFELYFQFRQLCPKSTTLVQDTHKKDMCYNCPTGTFNLADGQKCNKCPFVCQNSQMFLPEGYWRYSLMSYEYQECYLLQNCVGDINRQISQKLQSTTNRYCKEGNIGVLCMDCDLNGIYWDKRYQQITPYTCQ